MDLLSTLLMVPVVSLTIKLIQLSPYVESGRSNDGAETLAAAQEVNYCCGMDSSAAVDRIRIAEG